MRCDAMRRDWMRYGLAKNGSGSGSGSGSIGIRTNGAGALGGLAEKDWLS